MENLGFIGLGNAHEGIDCGYWLAERLLDAGERVYVWDSRPEIRASLAEKGALPCETCAEVAEHASVIFMMLMYDSDIEKCLFGPGGVTERVKEGSIVVDMSSIPPEREMEFCAGLKACGCEMMDAPCNGGGPRAKKDSLMGLNTLIGGSPEAYARCEKYFKILCGSSVHIGPCGHGQVAKVATQMMNAICIQAICEGLIYSSKMGADPLKIREAMLMRFIDEFLLEVHTFRPIDHMLEGFHVWEHQLDLEAALTAARRMGIYLPVTAQVQQLFNSIVAQGQGDWDHCSLILPLEAMSKQKVGEGVEIDVDWKAFFEYGARNVENFRYLMENGFRKAGKADSGEKSGEGQ